MSSRNRLPKGRRGSQQYLLLFPHKFFNLFVYLKDRNKVRYLENNLCDKYGDELLAYGK